MIIVAGKSHVLLAQQTAQRLGADFLVADTQTFADQELRIQVSGDLFEQRVVIVQSTSKPSNDHLMELLLIADTVKRAGAKRITAVIPYFGYSRQDRPSYSHGPISASLVARLIETAGIDQVITVDLHSRQSEGFFRIGVRHLDATALFAPLFQALPDRVVVSPDVGGLARARAFSATLNAALAVLNKNRTAAGDCVITEVIGEVADKHCILVDDIIDTGGTLCQAAQLLLNKGARSVSACITHAVLSGQAIARVQQAGFSQFYTTNSIPQTDLPDVIQVVPVDGLIATALHPLMASASATTGPWQPSRHPNSPAPRPTVPHAQYA